MKKYVAVEGCDKCHLGYIHHICQKWLGGEGCLYCRKGETVEACSCNSKPYQEYFDEPEGGNMKNKIYDIILDMNDKDFAEKLIKALGLKQGESVNFITPTFDRTDGRKIKYIPKTIKEYEALKQLDSESLKEIGCQIWDKENGVVTWLYPYEWYNFIPNRIMVTTINGETKSFEYGITDDDKRFGALSFGFTQIEHQK